MMKNNRSSTPYTIPIFGDQIPSVGEIIYDGQGGFVKVLRVSKPSVASRLFSGVRLPSATLLVVRVNRT
jgi:hypothetical protein